MSTVTVRSGRKRIDTKQRRLDIRDRLLAAIDTLAAQGEPYSTVSVERLATAAGISRATFYIYFEGKADLLQAWYAETVDELSAAADRWWNLGPVVSVEDLGDALGATIEIYLARAGLMTAINDEATQNSELRDTLAGGIQRAVDGLSAHIARGQQEGWIDPEVLAPETAAWIVWLIERGLSQELDGAEPARAALLRANLTSMLWHVLYGPARH